MKTTSRVGVEAPKKAEAFLAFEYAETKDLTKHFLTVVAAVLAVSVTFSEKVINFAEAGIVPRIFIMVAWCLMLVAFILGGYAIFLIFNAGLLARHTELYQEKLDYERLANQTFLCLQAGGAIFVLALVLLVVSGMLKILKF